MRALFSNRQNSHAGQLSGWRSVVCYFCTLVMFLPIATLLPLNLMQQFRLASEEEAHTPGVTVAETRDERRKPPTRLEGRMDSAKSSTFPRMRIGRSSTAARGEYRFLNGTGAQLLC